jgi:hypothetical protein
MFCGPARERDDRRQGENLVIGWEEDRADGRRDEQDNERVEEIVGPPRL